MTTDRSASFPILTTERLTLRRLAMDDAPQLFRLRSDAAVNRWLDRQPCQSVEAAAAFVAAINDGIEKDGLFYWAISFTGSPTLVGTICLFNFTQGRHQCEIGYELLPRFQGQGIMREAGRQVIGYCFGELGLQAVGALTHKDNQASEKLLRQLGFVASAAHDSAEPDLRSFILEK